MRSQRPDTFKYEPPASRCIETQYKSGNMKIRAAELTDKVLEHGDGLSEQLLVVLSRSGHRLNEPERTHRESAFLCWCKVRGERKGRRKEREGEGGQRTVVATRRRRRTSSTSSIVNLVRVVAVHQVVPAQIRNIVSTQSPHLAPAVAGPAPPLTPTKTHSVNPPAALGFKMCLKVDRNLGSLACMKNDNDMIKTDESRTSML